MIVNRMMFTRLAGGLLILASLIPAGCKNPQTDKNAPSGPSTDWPAYGGNKAENRYSTLQQINMDNVKDLQVAWTYDAREAQDGSGRPREVQCQPIVVKGVLYGTNAQLGLFALNAATGELLWKFESVRDEQRFNTNRGVVYWENGDDKRILYSSGGTLYAVDAVTGKLVPGFGVN